MGDVKDIVINETTGAETPVVENMPKKRGRKPNPEKKMYFSAVEEEMFKKFLATKDPVAKDKIFKESLYPVFSKMIESLIRTYTLFSPGENFDDTCNETMAHLITKINNFDESKGKKAFSYCGTICKNFLVHKRQKAQNIQKSTVSYETTYNEMNPDTMMYNDKAFDDVEESFNITTNIVDEINMMIEEPEKYNLNENDVKVGFAIVNVLTNWEEIFKKMDSNKYTKSSVDSFIKECTYLNTQQIRKSKKKFIKTYNKLKDEILTHN